jgi:hypothetical protein
MVQVGHTDLQPWRTVEPQDEGAWPPSFYVNLGITVPQPRNKFEIYKVSKTGGLLLQWFAYLTIRKTSNDT